MEGRLPMKDGRSRALRFSGISLAAAWFAFCAYFFLQRRPIPFGTERFSPPLVWELLTRSFFWRAASLAAPVALFWTAAWRLGRWLSTPLRAGGPSRLEEFILSLGFGAGALGLAALALGLAGGFLPRLLKAALAVLAAAAAPAFLRLLQDRGAAKRFTALGREAGLRGLMPAALLAALILYQFIVALGPTLFYDSLVYHLALPDLYLRRGAIVPTPLNAYAGIPGGVEMLYS